MRQFLRYRVPGFQQARQNVAPKFLLEKAGQLILHQPNELVVTQLLWDGQFTEDLVVPLLA